MTHGLARWTSIPVACAILAQVWVAESWAADPEGKKRAAAKRPPPTANIDPGRILAKCIAGRWQNAEADGFIELTEDRQVVIGTPLGLSFRGTYELQPGGKIVFHIRRPDLPGDKAKVVNDVTCDGDTLTLADPAADSETSYTRVPW